MIDWEHAQWALSLPIFAMLSLSDKLTWDAQIIAAAVVVHGVLCHGAYALRLRGAWWFRAWDVLFNLFAVLYINYHTTAQPVIALYSIAGSVAYLANQHIQSPTVHVTLVAQPFAVCLMHYSDKRIM